MTGNWLSKLTGDAQVPVGAADQGPLETTPTTKGVRLPAAPTSLAAENEYRAWGHEHPEVDDVIEIRCASGEWSQLYRSYLVRVEGVGDSLLSLFCTSCVVMISGRNLGELRRLVKARRVDYLQEHDPKRWPQLAPGVPLIESIELMQPETKEKSRKRASGAGNAT